MRPDDITRSIDRCYKIIENLDEAKKQQLQNVHEDFRNRRNGVVAQIKYFRSLCDHPKSAGEDVCQVCGTLLVEPAIAGDTDDLLPGS